MANGSARCPVGQEGFYHQCNGGTAQPVSGKTGSTDDGRTESFVAYTKEMAAAMIAANPNDPTGGVGSAIITKVYRAVAHTLASSLAGQPVQQFEAPSRTIASGKDQRKDPVPEPEPEATPSPETGPRPQNKVA